jgi:hypothetical protein
VIGTLRPALLAGAGMVLLGVLLLLQAVGLLPGGVPVGSLVVIGVGAALLLSAAQAPGGTAAAVDAAVPARVDLAGAASARLVLNHGAGTLRVGAGAAVGALVDGRVSVPLDQRVHHSGQRVEVSLQPQWRRWPTGWRQVTWDLALSDAVAIDLEVNTGAAQVRLDLSELTVRSLKLHTGASDVDVILPAHGQCRTSVSAGAASIRLRVPPGVAASVHNRSALASFTVDELRFPRANGRFESVDFLSAEDRVEIDVDGGVASFTVD